MYPWLCVPIYKRSRMYPYMFLFTFVHDILFVRKLLVSLNGNVNENFPKTFSRKSALLGLLPTYVCTHYARCGNKRLLIFQ